VTILHSNTHTCRHQQPAVYSDLFTLWSIWPCRCKYMVMVRNCVSM